MHANTICYTHFLEIQNTIILEDGKNTHLHVSDIMNIRIQYVYFMIIVNDNVNRLHTIARQKYI